MAETMATDEATARVAAPSLKKVTLEDAVWDLF